MSLGRRFGVCRGRQVPRGRRAGRCRSPGIWALGGVVGVGAHSVGGPGGGDIARGSGMCLRRGVFGWRVCWARCRPFGSAMMRATLRVGLCCCCAAGCRLVTCFRTCRVVFGVVGLLWGSGSAPCADVRCQEVVRAGCPPPPYSWGWARLRSRQVTPGVSGSLWPRGVVVGVVVPPVWTQALVGGSVVCWPSMGPERL